MSTAALKAKTVLCWTTILLRVKRTSTYSFLYPVELKGLSTFMANNNVWKVLTVFLLFPALDYDLRDKASCILVFHR